MNLYLDDLRPCPDGWTLARNITEAKAFLKTGHVERCSLDHDLVACAACLTETPDLGYKDGVMPSCSHVGTGYDLVVWMAETGHWPKVAPVVHSQNQQGKARMHQAIDQHYDRVK